MWSSPFWREEIAMKLVGDLKDKFEKTENQEEAKKAIEEAGTELSDDDLDEVAGGAAFYRFSTMEHTR